MLAWIVGGETESEPEVRLVNAAGKTVAFARAFAAPSLLESQTSPLAAPGEEHATVLPRATLFGALFALPADVPPGEYRLVAAGASAEIGVEARSFPLETIKLNQANTELRTVPTPRKTQEARRLYAVLDGVDEAAVFAVPTGFVFPVAGGRQSAGFGDRRRYVYSDGSAEGSVHAGIDWAVVAGTPVLACARGKVVLAANREVTGNTVVIEHLPGLYSLYFHLSSIGVAEGAVVDQGQVIARSGSTGMATGPHLHWELRAAGDAVDPEYWLRSPLLDKAALTAIIYGQIEGR